MSGGAERRAARIERTTEEVVDTVLAYVGRGMGGPHAEVQALLEALVVDEVQPVLGRVREALDSGDDTELGWSAASNLVDDLLKERT